MKKEKIQEIPEIRYQFEDEAKYKETISKKPRQEWVDSRDLGGNKKNRFVPLYVQQALADEMFLSWDIVSEDYQVIVNEILCTIKIMYVPSYPGAEVRYMTGTAAKPIQCASGTTPGKFPLGKFTNSLEYCAPSARSAAMSNAFSTIANIFGRNLNRKSVDNYSLKK